MFRETRTPERLSMAIPAPLRGTFRVGVGLIPLTIPLGMSTTIQGLSIANLIQVASVLLLIPAARWFTYRDLTLLVVLLASLPISTLPLLFMHGVPPAWPQLIFFELCILQLFLSVRAAPHVPLRQILPTSINVSVTIVIGVAAWQLLTSSMPYIDLYFDDKSHAAIACFSLSFMMLWANKQLWAIPIAILVYFVSVATASRLVLLGAPLLAIAALFHYSRSRQHAVSPLSVYAHHLVLLFAPLVVLVLANSALADALGQRLMSTNLAAEASTFAHLELIDLALSLKLSDPWILTLGAGPGGFAPGLRAFGVDITTLGSYDPLAYSSILTGFTPIHSATITILVEFPLIVAVAFVGFVIASGRALWFRSEWILFLLLVGLVLLTTFYSSHNEPFWTATLCLIALVAFSHHEETSRTSRRWQLISPRHSDHVGSRVSESRRFSFRASSTSIIMNRK